MEQIGRCVVIGASPDSDMEFIQKMIRPDDYVICADGGLRYALEAGIPVRLVVGDFDSGEEPPLLKTVRYPAEKDYTDLELAVEKGVEQGFRTFLILGGTGGRLPHTLANLLLMFRFARRGITVSMADPEVTAHVLTVPEQEAQIPPGHTYSVFSVGGDSVISEIGAKYPLDRYRLSGFDSIGISNESLDGAQVILHHGSVLILVE